MLTHRITRRIELAHEPGAWIEVRMPSLNILDQAREAKTRKTFALVSGFDLSQLKDFGGGSQDEGGLDYDWQVLLSACITAWSYEDAVTPENVAELDQATVDTIIGALVPTDTEDARKKGCAGSTMH